MTDFVEYIFFLGDAFFTGLSCFNTIMGILLLSHSHPPPVNVKKTATSAGSI